MYRSRWTAHLGLTLALLTSTGCGDPAGPSDDPNAPVQTSATSYSLEFDGFMDRVSIPWEFTNHLSSPVFFVNCGGAIQVTVERHMKGRWARAWTGIYPDCLSDPIRVDPGESIARSLGLIAPRPGSNVYPQFEEGTEPPGTYRIVLTSAVTQYDEEGPSLGHEVPPEFLRSNSFRIN